MSADLLKNKIKMNRKYLIILTSLILLASCVETSMDFDMPEESYEVSFSPDISTDDSFTDYVSKTTRATVTTNSSMKTFGVYTYETLRNFDQSTSTPEFMCNQKVEKQSSLWVYDPIKMWPGKVGDIYIARLSFFAYSPYAATGDVNSPIKLTTTTQTKGCPKISYIVPDKIKDQIDFLVADPLYNKTMADRDPKTKNLLVNFKHALSSISFTGTLNANLDSAKVTKIIQKNFLNTGEINYTNTSFTCDAIGTTKSDYELEYNSGLKNLALTQKNVTENIMETGQKLMVIPQNTYSVVTTTTETPGKWPWSKPTITTTTETIYTSIYLEIDYYLPFSDGGPVKIIREFNLNTLISGSLEMGKHYTINLTMGDIDNLTDLTVSCSIVDWNKVTVNVPTFD